MIIVVVFVSGFLCAILYIVQKFAKSVFVVGFSDKWKLIDWKTFKLKNNDHFEILQKLF
jgi:hypothetical protein